MPGSLTLLPPSCQMGVQTSLLSRGTVKCARFLRQPDHRAP